MGGDAHQKERKRVQERCWDRSGLLSCHVWCCTHVLFCACLLLLLSPSPDTSLFPSPSRLCFLPWQWHAMPRPSPLLLLHPVLFSHALLCSLHCSSSAGAAVPLHECGGRRDQVERNYKTMPAASTRDASCPWALPVSFRYANIESVVGQIGR